MAAKTYRDALRALQLTSGEQQPSPALQKCIADIACMQGQSNEPPCHDLCALLARVCGAHDMARHGRALVCSTVHLAAIVRHGNPAVCDWVTAHAASHDVWDPASQRIVRSKAWINENAAKLAGVAARSGSLRAVCMLLKCFYMRVQCSADTVNAILQSAALAGQCHVLEWAGTHLLSNAPVVRDLLPVAALGGHVDTMAFLVASGTYACRVSRDCAVNAARMAHVHVLDWIRTRSAAAVAAHMDVIAETACTYNHVDVLRWCMDDRNGVEAGVGLCRTAARYGSTECFVYIAERLAPGDLIDSEDVLMEECLRGGSSLIMRYLCSTTCEIIN